MHNVTASDTSAPINSIEANCPFGLEARVRAPQVVKFVSCLKPDGTNVVVWKTQLALVVYIFTNSEDYLDTPITSKSSFTIRSSAHEAFQALKQINICDPSLNVWRVVQAELQILSKSSIHRFALSNPKGRCSISKLMDPKIQSNLIVVPPVTVDLAF
ncbi:hypothetical protein CROQUDRAFT_97325 [Cronartium quercuum f. sp. fusiforme G11]|uniref:Uncharacterized protein n=1 Tax=Cronartium quercuum f. sp. fusiforme G11 TaxID=708437 RepID=A0A9P6NE79_9BASI|nr:hypothetical protein CROQUDRAFT_97325 [Cronartium quercuum f. sp. fusiforme G11]